MQASNESTSRENDSVKHFVPEEEPSRGSLRKHVGGCAPMLVLALLGVSVLAFLVARCALHLKNSRNSTTFLRRLAEEHWHCPGGPSRAAPAGQDPPRDSPPPYEEGSWPSTSGVSHGGARRAYSLDDILGGPSSAAIGPASRAATVSMLTLTAVDSSAPHPHRHREPRHHEHLFSFPRISDSKVVDDLNKVLEFLKKLSKFHIGHRKTHFETIFCGTLVEIKVKEKRSSLGWPRKADVQKIALDLESSVLGLVSKLAANQSCGRCESTVTGRLTRRNKTRAEVLITVVASLPPQYNAVP